jgi:hypothetical protein
MVEAVKSRFEDFDKRFQTLEKRFDDIKWYFAGASALFALFISLFTFVANSNFSSERSGLQQFRNDIRADLGKAESLLDGLADERFLVGCQIDFHTLLA